MDYGIHIKPGPDMVRLEMQCLHQHGLLYIVPSEASWVCSRTHLPAHALAGFLKALTALQLPQVRELMNRWGLFFRELPLDQPTESSD